MDIASMLEVEVQEVADSKENVTPIRQPQKFSCQIYSKEENDFYKLTYGSDVASVRFLRLHCTGCDEHIGSAPAEAHNMHEHPVLRTLLCAKCREFYGDGTFEQGDDATDMFCRWCANGGNLYCCSYCSNTFCSKCIKRNFDPPTIKRIEAEDSWKCFVCDPKDLFPLRSICRALITHIETVTRLLENDRRMSSKEIEEKMHLDETKCCSRKRKRRRRRTLSNSDDDNEDEDISYVPEEERSETPPAKKRKVRGVWMRKNSSYSNGYYDHEYYEGSRRPAKVESDLDPADLMMSCEQTMIEGDTEIMDSNNVAETGTAATAKKNSTPVSKASNSPTLVQVSEQPQQKQQVQKLNNMAINPVPLANLLKVALSTGAKKIKVTHAPNKKLVAVPMSAIPKSIAGSSNITFVKSPTHFLLPKSMTAQKSALQPKPVTQQQQPSVIDIDSDDDPVIMEKNPRVNSGVEVINNNSSNVTIVEDVIDVIEENIVPELMQVDRNEGDRDYQPIIMTEAATETSNSKTNSNQPPNIVTDGQISLKTRQRDQRFKKMLQLQSQEMDNTWSELKTKVMKLIQLSHAKSQQEGDPLGSAALCTKRFHRALRKALVELSHINDRVVKDYVDWKKKREKAAKEADKQQEFSAENKKEKGSSLSNENENKDDLTLEMICERDSASESESEDEIEILTENEGRMIEATDMPAEFSHFLDHLTIFKRKPTSVKAVGNSSVITKDKACQVYDVPWRDYEKCIGYSLVTRSDLDSGKEEETLQTADMPDENFGKYQEQFLFYLQHIEDFGIETDELKGLPDPNHIPLKDLIDGTSPFITDMLERLSPVTLSNGRVSPSSLPPSSTREKTDDVRSSPVDIDTSSPPNGSANQNSEPKTSTTALANEQLETENKTSDENVAATSKAVEELVKMVTKLSEDLRSESEKKDNKESSIEKETVSAVNSILEVTDNSSSEEQKQSDNEITDICATTSNDDECTILE